MTPSIVRRDTDNLSGDGAGRGGLPDLPLEGVAHSIRPGLHLALARVMIGPSISPFA